MTAPPKEWLDELAANIQAGYDPKTATVSEKVLASLTKKMHESLASVYDERDQALARADRAEADRDEAFAAGLTQVSHRAEAAEARADRAEARLAEAWDEGYAAPADAGHWENDRPRKGMRMWVPDITPNPYRSEATA